MILILNKKVMGIHISIRHLLRLLTDILGKWENVCIKKCRMKTAKDIHGHEFIIRLAC